MDPLQAIVLGLVQGLSEFIPISSSAHLIIVPWLLGWSDPGLTFDVALHIGTLVAVLAYFWQDWIRLIRAALASLTARPGATAARSASGRPGAVAAEVTSPGPGSPGGLGRLTTNPDAKIAWFILLATIPGALAGVLGEKKLDEMFHGATAAGRSNGILVIGVVMILLAGLLWLAERMARHQYPMEHLTLRQALIIGVAQAFAIIPGVSRSGSTITAGLFQNLTREAAARFSFLLGTPVILGAGVKKAYDTFHGGGIPAGDTTAFVLGFLVAAISGYATIFFLLRYLQRNSTLPFVVYRVVAGVLLIVLVLAGFRH